MKRHLDALEAIFQASPAEDNSHQFGAFVMHHHLESAGEIWHDDGCMAALMQDGSFCDCDNLRYVFFANSARYAIFEAKNLGIDVHADFYDGFVVDRRGHVVSHTNALRS